MKQGKSFLAFFHCCMFRYKTKYKISVLFMYCHCLSNCLQKVYRLFKFILVPTNYWAFLIMLPEFRKAWSLHLASLKNSVNSFTRIKSCHLPTNPLSVSICNHKVPLFLLHVGFIQKLRKDENYYYKYWNKVSVWVLLSWLKNDHLM